MYTTEPGVQLYTGNFLDGTLRGIGGTYDHWEAFTLEAQHFPNWPNHSSFPSTELTARHKYLPRPQFTSFAFVTAAPKTPVAAISFRITLPSPIPCWPPVSDCRQ
jgi:hypothetical protein